jgi:Electron transfer DM13
MVLLLAVGVLVWFQPQKLLIDQRVDEALPAAAAPASTEAGGPATPATRSGPVTLAAGEFRSLGHATTGRASALELGGGRRVLRLDDLRTSNGPDLFVYLSVAPAGGARDALDDQAVSLGRLKANQGNQNYEIPATVDLRRYRSVVIWCRRFTYAFGAAPLMLR